MGNLASLAWANINQSIVYVLHNINHVWNLYPLLQYRHPLKLQNLLPHLHIQLFKKLKLGSMWPNTYQSTDSRKPILGYPIQPPFGSRWGLKGFWKQNLELFSKFFFLGGGWGGLSSSYYIKLLFLLLCNKFLEQLIVFCLFCNGVHWCVFVGGGGGWCSHHWPFSAIATPPPSFNDPPCKSLWAFFYVFWKFMQPSIVNDDNKLAIYHHFILFFQRRKEEEEEEKEKKERKLV